MSLQVDGTWKGAVWADNIWLLGVWLEVAVAVPGVPSVYQTPTDFVPDVYVWTRDQARRKGLIRRLLLLG